jgi:hypothetical protein
VSDPTDIKALDEYLKGDSDVSRRYRELGRDEVPPELDRRVLAAARDAVAKEGTQRSRSWLRWSAPVALAASVVLIVTVVLERGPQDELVAVPAQAPAEPQPRGLVNDKDDYAAAERKLADEVTRQRAGNAQESSPVYIQPVTQAPPPAFADVPPMPESAPAAVPATKAEARPFVPPPDLVVEQQSDQTVGQSVAVLPQAPAVAPPAPAEREEMSARESAALSKEEADSATGVQGISITDTRARRGPGRTAGPRGTISSTSGLARESRPAADDERADRSDPAAWLEDIRDLRRAGKTADADREWDLFHKAFPDFQVADDDIARKKP